MPSDADRNGAGAAITKGNGHAWRRRGVDSEDRHLRRKAAAAPEAVQALAWACVPGIFIAGKAVTTAVARELAGFIWAIACEVQGRPHASRAAI